MGLQQLQQLKKTNVPRVGGLSKILQQYSNNCQKLFSTDFKYGGVDLSKKICTVSGCEGKTLAKGLCGFHYYRKWKFGSVECTQKERRTCSECDKPVASFGMCDTHYRYYRKKILQIRELEKERDRLKILAEDVHGEGVDELKVKLEESEEGFFLLVKELGKMSRKNKHLEKKLLELRDEIEYLRWKKPEYEESTLGYRLRRIRKMKGYSMEDTLERLNVYLRHNNRGHISLGHYEEWEEDLGRPDLIHLVLLGRIWDCSTRYLERGLIESSKNRSSRTIEHGGGAEEYEWKEEQTEGVKDGTGIL